MKRSEIQAVMEEARRKRYAVPAFDTVNYSYMNWLAEAATAHGTPVFLMFYPDFQNVISFREFIGFKNLLQEKYPVPLIAHLDHSKSLEEICEAVEAGFESVMIDASDQPFEQNVESVKRVVQFAHDRDVHVEAELGRVGNGRITADFKNKALYTNPQEAALFVAETDVDMLAVAIGSSHGIYAETPNLDIELLKEINHIIPVPLVLHGTSLIPEEQVKEAVKNGICKVNLATEMYLSAMNAVAKAVEEDIHEAERIYFAEKAVKPALMHYFDQKLTLLHPAY